MNDPGSTKFIEHPLVKKLVPDPAQRPDVVAFSGFLGRGTQAGHVRLYLTVEMNEYLEIAEGDIVHNQSTQTAEKPLGETKLWVRKGAEVQHIVVQARTAQAEFIQGEIMNTCLGDSVVAAETIRQVRGILSLIGRSCRPSRRFCAMCSAEGGCQR